MKIRLGIVVVAALAGAAFFTLRGPTPEPKWDVATKDAVLLARAWAASADAGYPTALLSQPNPSACGPASVANVSRSAGNALTTSADVAAKGRGCMFGICFGGLTLDQLATAAEDPRWHIAVLRDLSLEQFREELRHVSDPHRRYTVNFHRGPIFSGGGGHHSPVGAYLEAEDLVFVLDVNARYGPWLVKSDQLFAAMDTVDSASGKKRGLLRFELR
ncbi:MAG: phytochelatin synthase [Archangiaceae bacterium]|nr:phytochelatin synthase [Archangiaceae bacterium]